MTITRYKYLVLSRLACRAGSSAAHRLELMDMVWSGYRLGRQVSDLHSVGRLWFEILL